ncbi:MAG: hypothetical protein GXP19_04840 [Gammaproteobacteria bacterium]|nr:hypothetical protein [Gammaproteobacteria bacterium]
MNSDQAVLKAKQVLSQTLTIDEAQISVQEVSSVQWSDSSLGCPQQGMMYAQVITDGYKVVLELDNKLYPLHVGTRSGRAVLCTNKSKSTGQN